jgi:putative hydrolase of the HAD superfamily
MIKAVCFDLDGVYFTLDGKKFFQQALIDLSKDESKVIHVLYKCPEMLAFVKGELEEHLFWNFVRDYLTITLSDEELRELWAKGYEIDSEIQELIHKLKANGYIICTCSNNNIARVSELEKKFSFLKDFDVTVFSYQTGFVKPQKEIFQILIDKAQVAANEIVYSDDNPERIKGVAELGINTFLFTDKPQFINCLRDYEVKF